MFLYWTLVFGYVRKILSVALNQNWSLRWAKDQELVQEVTLRQKS